MKRIGLVIQGPLLSYGRTGALMRESPEKLLREGTLVRYDCRQNIQRLISDFGSLFDEIVVSTWDSELKADDAWPGATVVSSPDPGGIKQVNHANHYKDNNKYRQFVSTLRGLLELEKKGVTYAVKIRTDMYVDLGKLTESFFAGMKKADHDSSRAVYAPVVSGPNFLLHDIYFAADLGTMKEFCEAVLAYDRFEFMPSVHRETVLKYAYARYREDIDMPDWAYFPLWPPNGASAATRRIFEYMFSNVFFSLNPEILWSTTWRGVHFSHHHISTLLAGASRSPRRYNLPGLISTDWERYYAFRLKMFGKGISLRDRITINIGKWGWNLWNVIRRVGNIVTGASGGAIRSPTMRQKERDSARVK